MLPASSRKDPGPPVVVLGAGLTGLSAAYHLGSAAEVYEQHEFVGGHSRTKRVDGFNFDEGAHVFFGTDECSREFVLEPLAGELIEHAAEIWNNYGGRRYGRYPVQANAHALDPDTATRCLVDFVAALNEPERPAANYEEWCYASFGRTFSDEFMLRYARKIWTVEPRELTTEWLGSKVGGRITRPSLEQVIRGAVDSSPHELNYLTRFLYPRTGGFGRITQPLASKVPRVHLGNGLARWQATDRQLTFEDGSKRRYVCCIASVPLPDLVARCDDAPQEVRDAAARLMWTSLRCVNLGVARPGIEKGDWSYFYDHDVPFFRVSFPHRFSPDNAPANHSAIACEIAYSRRKPLDESDLVGRVVTALQQAGLLDASDRIVVADQIDVPFAYVVFDHARRAAVETIHSWLRVHGVIPSGRFGSWGYHWSFEAIASGRQAAEEARAWGAA